MSDQNNRRPAILLAVLVVLGGFVVLLVLGTPLLLIAIQAARETAKREQAKHNLAQARQALESFQERQALEDYPERVATAEPNHQDTALADALAIIRSKNFVDLTHAFAPGIPHWPGFPDEERETVYGYDEGVGTMGSGFFAERYSLVGQWGTHCDPPVHFAKGKRTIDQIDVKEMILPLVVIDVHEEVAKNPDYTISMENIRGWETEHGPIPEGAFVAMRTDWSKRWPDPKAMRNEDENGVAHYPGWSPEVLKYLYEEQEITASGHETLDTDPGVATSKGDYSLETYVLGTDHYQIELLANLDRVPEAGAVVVATFPKPKDGSGFPARVFAILP